MRGGGARGSHAMRDKLAALLRSAVRAPAPEGSDKLRAAGIGPVLVFPDEGHACCKMRAFIYLMIASYMLCNTLKYSTKNLRYKTYSADGWVTLTGHRFQAFNFLFYVITLWMVYSLNID